MEGLSGKRIPDNIIPKWEA